MYEKTLVPLDGPRAFEAILPSVAWLAGGLGSEVNLLNVPEPLRLQGGVHPTRRFRLANINILEESAETELNTSHGGTNYGKGPLRWDTWN